MDLCYEGGDGIYWEEQYLVVALSSCEAEYIVTLLCASQDIWIMNLLDELVSSEGEVVKLLVDNEVSLLERTF